MSREKHPLEQIHPHVLGLSMQLQWGAGGAVLLDVPTAARLSGYSERTIKEECAFGRLSHMGGGKRGGGPIKIDTLELARWIRKRQEKCVGGAPEI